MFNGLLRKEGLEAPPTVQEVKEIIKHLKLLGREVKKPSCTVNGICRELIEVFDINFCPFSSGHYDFYDDWEFYSGSLIHPVKHPEHRSPKRAFEFTANIWVSEYGARRKSLCFYIADKLDQMLRDEI